MANNRETRGKRGRLTMNMFPSKIRRDKQYEFLDNKYPRDMEVKWRPTADRVVQYATSYFRNCVVSRILGSTYELFMRVCAKNKDVKTVKFSYLIGLRYGRERWRTTCFMSGMIKTTVKIVATTYVLLGSIQRTTTCSLK
ncbi:hypothetical protein LINPERHAP1_LOCUS5215 [Linum perenne]